MHVVDRALLPPCVPPFPCINEWHVPLPSHRSVVHVVDRALLPYCRTVLDVAAAQTDLDTFVQAVKADGTYASVASGETPFTGTIFTPNDE